MWTCPKCKEQIEDQFDMCWKCAGDKDHRTTDHRTTDHRTTDHKTTDHETTEHKTTKPFEHLESICLAIAFLPGVLFFVRGAPTNSAQATFRIATIVIGFVVGLGGFAAIKIYQRRKGPRDH